MFDEKITAGKRSSIFLAASFSEFLYHSRSLFSGSSFALLGVDRLEHFGHQLTLERGVTGEHIAVKGYGAALVLGFGEYFSHSLQHTKALVFNNESYAIQVTATQPLEKADPTGLVPFHTRSGTQNLTVSVLIDYNYYQNSYIFELSALFAVQVDSIHIDIWIAPTLQGTVAPIHDVDIHFLVQFSICENYSTLYNQIVP